MIPDSKANIVMASTHRSVLLSTKTRKAPIPLVNQSSIPTHHEISPVDHIFLLRYHSVSRTSHNQNTNTKSPLKKLRLTATVSGDSQKKDLIGSINANQNVM